MDLTVSIDLTDEDTVDSDFATAAFGDVAVTLRTMPEDIREEFLRIVRELADEEEIPERRELLREFPEHFDLLDEDDEDDEDDE
ncbi:hypothetical protein ACFYWX_30495 [Streptomyces sp. NPDC002888]|uniref:hypothetical protein n=1 Tax=Streptomyces sp. NPDC002888 TaxID=3364668 RepID=UPI0036A19FF0